MSTITLTLSNGNAVTANMPNMADADLQQFIEDYADQIGYRAKIKNERQDDGTLIDPDKEEGAMIDNPKTKLEFAAEQTVIYWGNHVRRLLIKQAQDTAGKQADEAVSSKTQGWDVTIEK